MDYKMITTARKEAGLSMASLASEIGVNRSTVWRWENGRAKPDIEAIRLIASATNKFTSDFIKE